MNKKPNITAISLSQDTLNLLSKLQNKFQKNRSQLIRDIVNLYAKNTPVPISSVKQSSNISENMFSENYVLKKYFELIQSSPHSPVLVIGIAVINRKDRVLVGLRKQKDNLIRNLSWTFPSGKFSSLDFENDMEKTIRIETGFQAKVLRLVHARVIPDSPKRKIKIIAIYYHCKILSGTARPGHDFSEIKWVPAADVPKYFTTSVSDEIMNFLGNF